MSIKNTGKTGTLSCFLFAKNEGALKQSYWKDSQGLRINCLISPLNKAFFGLRNVNTHVGESMAFRSEVLKSETKTSGSCHAPIYVVC